MSNSKEIYRVKIDQLMISGGIVSENIPSLSLGMPSVDKKNYVMLNIKEKKKLSAIKKCIDNLLIAEKENDALL